MIYLELSNSTLLALVDDEDYSKCTMWKWNINNTKTQVRATIRGRVTPLANYVMLKKPQTGFHWDHIDRDFLNNQKSNLRLASHAQNAQNAKIRSNNSTGYRGVSWNKEREMFEVRIKVNGVHKAIGRFLTAEKAAKAYNRAAIQHYGEFATLNQFENKEKK